MNVNAKLVFNDPHVAKTLSTIYLNCVVVPANKAQNIFFWLASDNTSNISDSRKKKSINYRVLQH